MELDQIEAYLESPNPQNRMKAMVALRDHEPEVVVPLLKQRIRDQEFIVRSFVAMGLGNKQTEEGFEALLTLLKTEQDPNVVSEAANSLEKFGDRAIPHLVQLFEKNAHWLVRQSIFAALENAEPDILWQLCQWGWSGDDTVVKGTAIEYLGQLRNTACDQAALGLLLESARSEIELIRAKAAITLKEFDHPTAKAALAELRQDSSLRVVGAALESLL